MMRLGRVRFADLEEGAALGEGTFGTVMAGTYRGRDVAIKKARGALGSAPIMEAFRSVRCLVERGPDRFTWLVEAGRGGKALGVGVVLLPVG